MEDIDDFLKGYPIEEWEHALLFIKMKIKESRDGFPRWTNLTEDDINEFVELYNPENRKQAMEYIIKKREQAEKYHQ